MRRLLPIDAGTYERSPLHGPDRVWQETNCYVDLWIEALHALGLDPAAALAFTLSADFDGEQWQFIKFPLEDLWTLYGIDVAEMNPWRGLEHHIDEQLDLGRWITAEVDSWYLPDTAGVSYRIEHVKTSIVPNMIDRDARRLGYFHGASYYELSGEDYLGVLGLEEGHPTEVLPPYVELIRFEHLARHDDAELLDRVIGTIRKHLARRPDTNPVKRFGTRFAADVDWLRSEGMGLFHLYAFATLRQCGSTAELAASLCGWLGDRGEPTAPAGEAFSEVARATKAIQFQLARLVNGRDVDVTTMIGAMEGQWESAMESLADIYR